MTLWVKCKELVLSITSPLSGGLCCKTIFRIRARKIDSRSSVNAQHRFKNSFAPIRLLRISIPQLLRGDFCNTIGRNADGVAFVGVIEARQQFVPGRQRSTTDGPKHNRRPMAPVGPIPPCVLLRSLR